MPFNVSLRTILSLIFALPELASFAPASKPRNLACPRARGTRHQLNIQAALIRYKSILPIAPSNIAFKEFLRHEAAAFKPGIFETARAGFHCMVALTTL